MTRPHIRVDAFVAGAIAILVGLQLALPGGATVASVASLLLAPVWVPLLRNHVGSKLLITLLVAAAISGIILTSIRSHNHEVSAFLLAENTLTLSSIALSVGVLLWARHMLGAPRVALLVGVGMLATIPLTGADETNVWRFSISIPITVVVLAIAAHSRSRLIELLALTVIAGVSLLNDARSGTAILVVTALVVLWQLIPLRPTRDGAPGSRSTLQVVVTITAAVASVYAVAIAAIGSGVFGAVTQQRTADQLEASGSLILGGRPESGAAIELIRQLPAGYGSGTIPSLNDIEAARLGMIAFGHTPDSGYIENYMFGGGYEVHSIIGDFWIRYGIVGLVLTAFMLLITFTGVVRRIRFNLASALLIYLGIRMLWNLAFSPVASSALLVTLFLALALPHVSEPGRFKRARHAVVPHSQLPTDRGVLLP